MCDEYCCVAVDKSATCLEGTYRGIQLVVAIPTILCWTLIFMVALTYVVFFVVVADQDDRDVHEEMLRFDRWLMPGQLWITVFLWLWIAFAGVAVLLMICFCVFSCRRKKHKQRVRRTMRKMVITGKSPAEDDSNKSTTPKPTSKRPAIALTYTSEEEDSDYGSEVSNDDNDDDGEESV